MKKKLDVMLTKGLGDILYTMEFLKNPSKCIERLGTRDEMHDRVVKAIENKYV